MLSLPRECFSDKHVMFPCLAVVDDMNCQAGNEQRGRTFEMVDAQEGEEHGRQEKGWESQRLAGG